MKSRIVLIFLMISAAWCTLLARAVLLQIFPDERLAQLQRRQFETTLTVSSRRGAILDRQGKELAITINTKSLFADPQMIDDPYRTAQQLKKILGLNFRDTNKKLRAPKGRFVWLKRQLSKDEAERVKALGNRGLGLVDEPKRVYPKENLLSQTLGFVGRSGHGLEGLELAWDDHLKGQTRKIIAPRDARGRPLLKDVSALIDIPDGADLKLTIDSELQFVLEKELQEAMERHEAHAAYGVILDAHTSEVLAVANSPQFDLNEALRYSRGIRKNKAVTDAFEPGSTMKTFVIAGAIQQGVVKPSTRINCEGGRMKIGDRWIKEADAHHMFDSLTVTEILAESSNVGVTKIAFKMGAKKIKNILEQFGFGEKPGIGFPGEGAGIINKLPWRPILLSNVAFGHGVAATPLQIANAYAAIANGGVLHRPRIIKAVHRDGEWVEEPVEEVRRVLTPQQASTMTLMLTTATSDSGTGANARIRGFPVAGKTGTAQKVDFEHGGYIKGAYVSSFAGFVPAHNPKFVIYIAVDDPKKDYYGSQVAAPVFAHVSQYAVRKAGLTPVLINENNMMPLLTQKSPTSKAIDKIKAEIEMKSGEQMPNLVGLSLREVLNRTKGSDLHLKIEGSGWVARTSPAAGEALKKNQPVELIFKE
jgi:cell division protein FtsI (penicillin-binding protein 3)